MKTRTWIILFAALAVVCAGLSLFFFCAGDASRYAEVYSDGELVLTLDLQVDGTYRVGTADQWNVLTVENGKVSVSEASCPSQDCVRHLPSDRGAPIVCLPNRMVIKFADEAGYDALIG